MEQIEIWEKLYPNTDIERVLRYDIPRWIDGKIISREPLRVKAIARKKDWKTTIVNWLKREQVKEIGL